MIAWSIAAAASSRHLARSIISTDDEEIAAVARKWGGDAPFLRPAELATDEASVTDAVIHALDVLNDDFSHVVLLQASSPLRRADDIDGAIELCFAKEAPSCVSVTAVSKGPEWMFELDQALRLKPLVTGARPARRQDQRKAVIPNGAVYCADVAWLRAKKDFYSPLTVGYIMPVERSADVDNALDLAAVRSLLRDDAFGKAPAASSVA
jgi:N-acylneuraminate cytidylyltransferase